MIARCLPAAFLLALSAAWACSSSDSPDNDEPGIAGSAVLTVDVSLGIDSETMNQLKDTLDRRLTEADVGSDIDQTGERDLTVHFDGHLSGDSISQLLTAANLNFRQPTRDLEGDIRCQTEEGTDFSVSLLNLTHFVDAQGRTNVPCTAASGQTGQLEWEPAAGDVNLSRQNLTQAMIIPDQAKQTASISSATGETVVLAFTSEGAVVFSSVTAGLAGGYPLGLFLGDRLLSAPAVQGQITGEATQIENVTRDEALIVVAIIKGGELPIPVTLTSLTLD